MSTNLKVCGIILKTLDYKETSQIVYLYTEKGVISILVRGAKKYKSNKLSLTIPLTLVECIITDSKLPSLIDYTVLESYDYIKDDLKKNLWAQFLLEIISKVNDNFYSKNIYNLLLRTFKLANVCDIESLVIINMIKLLKAFGVEPNFKSCVFCESNNIEFFSIKNGGTLCTKHKTSDAKKIEEFKLFKELYYFDLYNNSNIILFDNSKLFTQVLLYYETHVDIKLKLLNTLIF